MAEHKLGKLEVRFDNAGHPGAIAEEGYLPLLLVFEPMRQDRWPEIEAKVYTVVRASNSFEALRDAITQIRNKAEHAKDNPRIQTDKLFDIIEICDETLALAEGK